MWWRNDDELADRLIANNAARPLPGMEKPNIDILAMSGWVQRNKTIVANDVQRRARLKRIEAVAAREDNIDEL